MKASENAELARAINRQAHMLTALSFPAIRSTLEEKARAMLKGGRSLEETLQEVRAAGLNNGTPKP